MLSSTGFDEMDSLLSSSFSAITAIWQKLFMVFAHIKIVPLLTVKVLEVLMSKRETINIDELYDSEANTCSCGALEGTLHKRYCIWEVCCNCHKLQGYDCYCSPKERKGKSRFPFVLYPQLCSRCGETWPEFFMVPNKEWKRYIDPQHREDIVCRVCYAWIKNLIDTKGKGKPPSLPLPPLLKCFK